MIHDVVVLGATVAGLTAARTLARSGFDVVVLDPNLEHRSAAIGHGVAAAGHASTVVEMQEAYGEGVAIEHVVRNMRGTDFIRSVLVEAELQGRELGFVDGTLGDASPARLREVAHIFAKAGAETDVSSGTINSQALVVDPRPYAEALRDQAVAAGAQVVHGVTVTHIKRKEGATGIAFRSNVAWASEPGAVAAVAVVDTIGVSPWGKLAGVAAAQWVPTARVHLANPIRHVELRTGGQTWLVRPDGDEHLILGQKSSSNEIARATAALVEELEADGSTVLATSRLAIDPSDHGRPVVGASGIPGGYFVRGNGRGEMMNGTASGLWLAETLIGHRSEGHALPLNRRVRAQTRAWLLAHRR